MPSWQMALQSNDASTSSSACSRPPLAQRQRAGGPVSRQMVRQRDSGDEPLGAAARGSSPPHPAFPGAHVCPWVSRAKCAAPTCRPWEVPSLTRSSDPPASVPPMRAGGNGVAHFATRQVGLRVEEDPLARTPCSLSAAGGGEAVCRGGGARRRVGELATMMAGTRPKASGGGSIWKYLLPALVGCHLFVSFCFVQYFMPSDTPGMGLSMSSTADQVCRLHMRFRVW